MLKMILLLLILMNVDLSAKEWVLKINIPNESIETLQCTDSINCYAFMRDAKNATNKIYKSIDQGNTWQIIFEDHHGNYPHILSMSRCFVLDTSNIYITYMDKMFLDKSTDGGKTFERTVFESDKIELIGTFTAFKMFNRNIGLITTSSTFLIYTLNAWETYSIVDHGEKNYTGAPMFFIDSVNVALSKDENRCDDFNRFNLITQELESYYDAGETQEGEEEKRMYDVCFVNDSVGFACGGQGYGAGINAIDLIWRTSDKGRNWNIIHNKKREGTVSVQDISFSDEKHGMATGNFGKILETTNGGETWSYHTDLPEYFNNYFIYHIAIAGQYPMLTTVSKLYRYEDDVSVQESEFKDVKFDIKQTPEHLTINISDENHRKYRLQIVDIQGKSMYEGNLLYSLENVVGLSRFAQGGYIYRILCGNVLVRSGKFVVAR